MKRRGFTLVELMVVISIIVILLAVLLPALGVARVLVRKGSNKSQIRGMVMQFTTYANSNKEWYPGLNSDGNKPTDFVDDSGGNPRVFDGKTVTSVTDHSLRQSSLTRLVMENFVSEKSMKSPGEIDPKVINPDVDSLFTAMSTSAANYAGHDTDTNDGFDEGYNDRYQTHGSYAILEYWDLGDDFTLENSSNTLTHSSGTPPPREGTREATTLGKLEWRLTGSPTAIVIADRHLLANDVKFAYQGRLEATKEDDGSLDSDIPLSYWSKDSNVYEGAVGFNDGHVEDLEGPRIASLDPTNTIQGIVSDARYGAAGSATGVKKINHLFRWDASNTWDITIPNQDQNFSPNNSVGDGRLIAD